MFGTLAKMISYMKAPRKTFITLHPVKTLKLGVAYLAGKALFGKTTKKDRAQTQES